MTILKLPGMPTQNAGGFGDGQMFGWVGGGKSLNNVYFCRKSHRYTRKSHRNMAKKIENDLAAQHVADSLGQDKGI